ncbi:hypothetical protein X777_06104, partial [Ooceraea biroi]
HINYLGPTWLPLIGCLLSFRQLCLKHGYVYRAVNELANTYGPVLGLKLGNENVVVISSYDVVKEAFLQEDLNGRPDGFFFRLRAFGKRKGVLFTDGNTWSQCRKFTMRYLRTFGFGQEILREQLSFQSLELVNYLDRMSEHGPVHMNKAFDITVLNSLWFMFAGRVFDYNDEKLKTALLSADEAFRLIDNMGGMVNLLPFLRFIAPQLSGYNDMIKVLTSLWNFLDEEIKMHEKHLTDEPRDLIDAFLLEISKQEDNNTIFDRENLLVLCLDLFLAGSKTTSDTLANAFLYLSLNTKWITVLQEELYSVVGKSRAPIENDLPSLPQMEAFLAEMQRYLVLAPLGVPHRAMKDVSLNGYLIPKDSTILFNLYSVHYDEKYWDKPNEFRPQRFLDKEGKFCRQNYSMPFGLGKRRCLGEQLARSSLFLYFSHIVQCFNMELSAEHAKPDLEGCDGFTIEPKPYYLKLTKRLDVKY